MVFQFKKKNILISELEAEVKKLKAELGRGSNNNNRSGNNFNRAESAESKKKRYCTQSTYFDLLS